MLFVAIAFVKAKAHILGLVVGILISSVAALLGIISGGAGHGDYFVARLIFPFTMLSTLVFDSITTPFVVVALAQFPVYGWLVGNSVRHGRWIQALSLFVVHMGGAVLSFLVPHSNFS